MFTFLGFLTLEVLDLSIVALINRVACMLYGIFLTLNVFLASLPQKRGCNWNCVYWRHKWTNARLLSPLPACHYFAIAHRDINMPCSLSGPNIDSQICHLPGGHMLSVDADAQLDAACLAAACRHDVACSMAHVISC